MMKSTICVFAFLAAGLIVATPLFPALAQVRIDEGGVYRVIRTDGREFVGEVSEQDNAYRVTVGKGIVMTILKSQVREILPAEEEQTTETHGGRRTAEEITDEEIEAILGSESVEDLYVWDYVAPIDLSEPLDLDPESLDEMLRYAGQKAKVLETDHFVVVYTSDTTDARRLVARLETVYRWNVAFINLCKIPPKLPEHKFEVFYFGTFDEYQRYQTLCGFLESGALGFYMRTNNRCAFFDLKTLPTIAYILEQLKDPRIQFEVRRRLENELTAWSNWMNLGVIQHETTHAIHFNMGVFPKMADVPTWMVEGLCVQFEVPPNQEGGCLGSVNYNRLDHWRKMYGPRGQGVPWQFVKTMVLSDQMGYHDYVMGWALNYYLRKKHLEEYSKWMQLLAAREDDWSVRVPPGQRLEDFESIFGRIDEEWVEEMFEFIGNIPMKWEAIVQLPWEKERRP